MSSAVVNTSEQQSVSTIKDDLFLVLRALSESVVLFLVPMGIFSFTIFLLTLSGVAGSVPAIISFCKVASTVSMGLLCAGAGYRTGLLKGYSHIACVSLMLMAMIASKSVFFTDAGAIQLKLGDLLTTIIVCLLFVRLVPMIEKMLKGYSILFTPTLTIILSVVGLIIVPYSTQLNVLIGGFITYCMTLAPFFMGGLIAMVFFAVIASPLSSVALGVITGISGLAAGSAALGVTMAALCLAMIVGRLHGYPKYLIMLTLGGPKLLLPLVFANPKVMLLPFLCSFVFGGLSALFGVTDTTIGAGFGFLALIGIGEIFKAGNSIINVVIFFIVVPIAVGYFADIIARKVGFYENSDLKIDV